MPDAEQLDIGDHVVFPANGRVHWIIAAIDRTTRYGASAHLISGMTGRMRYNVDLDEVLLFQKGRAV